MALGFDFNQLMQDPAFQMGIGMLAQPRSWDNRGFTGVARGVQQGMGNVQQFQQAQLQQQAQQMQMAAAAAQLEDAKKKREAADRRMQVLKEMGTAYVAKQPKPRPMAFKPQEGDDAVLANYQDAEFVGKMLEAGVDPTDIANFNKVLNPQAERKTHVVSGNLVDETGRVLFTAQDKPETGPAAELGKALAAAEKYKGTATGKFYERLVQKLTKETGGITIDMRPMSGFQTIVENGVPKVVAVQIDQKGNKQVVPIGDAPQTGSGGTLSLTNEQKRQQSLAALKFADEELARLDKMIESNPRNVGPTGYVGRAYETAKGVAFPNAKTPSIDTRNEQLNILAAIKKRLGDIASSNRDTAQNLEIIGGGIATTAGASRKSIETLRKNLKAQQEALERAAPQRRSTDAPNDWFARAKAANPGMSDEQIKAEGKRLGKM